MHCSHAPPFLWFLHHQIRFPVHQHDINKLTSSRTGAAPDDVSISHGYLALCDFFERFPMEGDGGPANRTESMQSECNLGCKPFPNHIPPWQSSQLHAHASHRRCFTTTFTQLKRKEFSPFLLYPSCTKNSAHTVHLVPTAIPTRHFRQIFKQNRANATRPPEPPQCETVQKHSCFLHLI